jgi:copper chaperone CopZ
MNRRIRFASAVLAVLVLAVFAGTAVQAGDDKEGRTDVTLTIVGMTCGACSTKVETAVNKLEGVVAAKADYEAGSATITYLEGEVTVDQIVATINEKTSFKASVPKPKV